MGKEEKGCQHSIARSQPAWLMGLILCASACLSCWEDGCQAMADKPVVLAQHDQLRGAFRILEHSGMLNVNGAKERRQTPANMKESFQP